MFLPNSITHRLRQHVHPAMRTAALQIRIRKPRIVLFATTTSAEAGWEQPMTTVHRPQPAMPAMRALARQNHIRKFVIVPNVTSMRAIPG
jgi:hypothetical protein